MSKKSESKSIEQIMAEADELVRQINADAIKEMEEEHRLEFEKHAQNFRRIKSEIQEKIDKKGISEMNSGADGMHEAIRDIVKSMQELRKYLF